MSLHVGIFTITEVHDGDTMMGVLDLGYDFFRGSVEDPVPLRVYGINSPELTTKVDSHITLNQPGEDATQHLLMLLGGANQFAAKRKPPTFGTPGNYVVNPGVKIRVVAFTKLNPNDDYYEKYGRILARIFFGSTDEPLGINVGATMLADGYAVLDTSTGAVAP